MLEFLRGDHDVLCSTTIIESGLDIPQANTLIVERADLLGLAQPYQIRGRVGRSERTAHAYLMYPDGSELSDEARARLAALADYTELGSGYRIAMRDLELRGAGNLLGDEQSGHVAAVGFELYCEMLAEAVAELSGTRLALARPVRVDAAVDAYVPPTTSRSRRPRSTSTGGSPSRGRSTTCASCVIELADRFGAAARAGREPAARCRRRGSSCGRLEADYVSVRGRRRRSESWCSAPSELRSIRNEIGRRSLCVCCA